MDIVILDGYVINPGDLSWDKVGALCDNLTVYDRTAPEDYYPRMNSCAVLMTSKCMITRELMEKCPDLKYIGLTATGYNNVDVKAAADLGIAVTNIPAYSTDAVAQHAIALILELASNVAANNDSVQRGEWCNSTYFCYWAKPVVLLAGKSIGIIGYGSIGKRVAEIAKALGMTVNIYSQDPEATMKSDFITLHCPLTPENTKMINAEFLSKMKPGSYLINTARGGLVNEQALADALKSGHLAGAGVDVLSTEPPKPDNPLLNLDNCIITPHMAWSPKEMRQAVIDNLATNLQAWLDGERLNRVDG